MRYDVFVYRIGLPEGINEMVTPNRDDDGYTIYIKDTLDDCKAIQAYQHAMKHILCNDFEKENVQEIELNAHK